MRALIGNRGAWTGLLLLAGCAAEPPPPPAPLQQPPPSPPPQAAAAPAALAPASRPPSREPSPPLVKPSPSPTETMHSPGPGNPAPGDVAAVRATSLVGLSMAELEQRLGKPAAAFDRAPAKVWQYRTGECVLDVYFYLDVARNAFHSLHHDAKRDGVQDEGCIRRIQDARRHS